MAEYIEREAAKRWLAIDYAYAAAKLLDEIPAADVVEVKHGRWVEKTNPDHFDFKLICSVCFGGSDLETNYCQNCGARMDGERYAAY